MHEIFFAQYEQNSKNTFIKYLSLHMQNNSPFSVFDLEDYMHDVCIKVSRIAFSAKKNNRSFLNCQ